MGIHVFPGQLIVFALIMIVIFIVTITFLTGCTH